MRQPQTITGPDGRAVAVLYEGSNGTPYRWVSNPYSIRGNANFMELVSIPLHPDDNQAPPRPALVRGQIIITAQIVFDVGSHAMCAAEVEVDGYIGSTPTTIYRTFLGGAGQTGQIMRVNFDATDTFDKLAIRARQILDWVPSSLGGTDVVQNNIAAIAYMWSS